MRKSENPIFIKSRLVFITLLLTCFSAKSQELSGSSDTTKSQTELNNLHFGLFPKQVESVLHNLTISGFYRFTGNYLSMKVPYYNTPNDSASFRNSPKKVFIGDDAQIPELMLNISGKPTPNTTFSTDFYLWNPMTGLASTNYAKGLNLGVNLYGSFATDIGNFNIMTGGIHWYSLTPFTFYTNVGYNRFTIFERNPWDPGSRKVEDRYRNFYESGGITQDTRWGKQAFQGIIVEGNDLPYNFSVVGMYGKSVLNGGMSTIPNFAQGGKIKKTFGNNFVSINTFNSKTFVDSLDKKTIGYNMHTVEYNLIWKDIKFYGEVGMGKYYSPAYTKDFTDSTNVGKYGEALSMHFFIPKKYTFIPIEFHFFRINSNVINNNSIFWNSSVVETPQNTTVAAGSAALSPFASSMTQVGQITNNRQGFEINTEIKVKKLKISFGNSIAQEIDNISSQITYGHPTNNLALSRFWRWSAYPTPGLGPYGNLTKVYRGVYETVNVTDSVLQKKHFNTIEVNAKYAFKLFNKDIYVNYLGSFGSVQKKLSPITVFNEDAYIRAYYHQAELYVKLNSKLVLTNYVGCERVIGNYNTNLDSIETINTTTNVTEIKLTPRNQVGWSYATGFDLSLGKNVGLYVRQRWFTYHSLITKRGANLNEHEYRSFAKDRYQGFETTVELKMFF